MFPYVISERSGNKINSIASLLSTQGYQTAFFHGAPNGSMGFDAFTKIAGFHQYFGRDEYGNDDDFDNIWGIWDEPFFQFFARGMNHLQAEQMHPVHRYGASGVFFDSARKCRGLRILYS